MDPMIALRLGIALGIGFIIGIERGWAHREAGEGERAAGVRTFALVGLLGGVAALVSGERGLALLAVALLGLIAIAVAGYWAGASRGGDLGTTTEFALVLTFLLGALALRGLEIEAVAAAVVATALLGFKRELHGSLERLERREILATLQLLLIAAVLIPLLPNRGVGPWSALNPRTLGLLALLIVGVSYLGYFAVRVLGARLGLLATAMIGGLASSTAVTVSYSRMARQQQVPLRFLGAGIALACATMVPRLVLLVLVVDASLLPHLAVPLSVLAVVPAAAAMAVAGGRRPAPETTLELRNPLQLETAAVYTAALAGLLLLIRGAREWIGEAGVYVVSVLSGIADVDALTLALAQAARIDLAPSVAARGIVLGALVNTGVKAGLAATLGGWALGRWSTTVLLGALVAAGLATLLTGS